jgi:hypothetical protein
MYHIDKFIILVQGLHHASKMYSDIYEGLNRGICILASVCPQIDRYFQFLLV